MAWQRLGVVLLTASLAGARQAPPPLLGLRGGASSQMQRGRTACLQPSDGMGQAERVYVQQQFTRPAIRTAFLSRVYSIVMLQVLFTAAVMAALRRSPAIAYSLLPKAPLFFLLASLPALAIQWMPAVAEQAPYGQLLLAAFTGLTGLGLGAATAMLPAAMLLQAAVATSAAVGGLATYATTTKRDFTASRGMLFAGLMSLLGLGLLQMLTRSPWISVARAYLGALVFSGYLVYDTQLIAGGGRRFQLRPTQHVLGALMIFSDMLNLFIAILSATSKSDRD